jgi:hypothetical protein
LRDPASARDRRARKILVPLPSVIGHLCALVLLLQRLSTLKRFWFAQDPPLRTEASDAGACGAARFQKWQKQPRLCLPFCETDADLVLDPVKDREQGRRERVHPLVCEGLRVSAVMNYLSLVAPRLLKTLSLVEGRFSKGRRRTCLGVASAKTDVSAVNLSCLNPK